MVDVPMRQENVADGLTKAAVRSRGPELSTSVATHAGIDKHSLLSQDKVRTCGNSWYLEDSIGRVAQSVPRNSIVCSGATEATGSAVVSRVNSSVLVVRLGAVDVDEEVGKTIRRTR